MENNITEEVNLIDLLRLLKKNKIIILLCFCSGILFALAVIFFYPKEYKAEAVIKIGQFEKVTGEMVALQDATQLIDEAKFFFLQKYPSLGLALISDGIIDINNYSTDENKAKAGVSDVVSEILSKSDNAKGKIQARIKQLQDLRDKFNW